MFFMHETDVVTVRGLRKSYGGRRVVDDLDLDVGAGEIVGLIGANGAGKTTTVECVQGLRRPDAGTTRVFGLDPQTQGDRLRSMVGSQLQDSALPDRLRVGEALYLFGVRDGEELLQQFGLAHRQRSTFASLSGGERQRLFLVLALANRPRLVILDELTQVPSAARPWAAEGWRGAGRQAPHEGSKRRTRLERGHVPMAGAWWLTPRGEVDGDPASARSGVGRAWSCGRAASFHGDETGESPPQATWSRARSTSGTPWRPR
jgi:ABC-type transport system involved in cytochrome c biogenesis ATPase subunit